MMMFKALTQNWNLMRIIRLVVGGYALIEAYRGSDTLMALLGFVLVGMALLNAGCGAQGCSVPNNSQKQENSDKIEYEEVLSK
jgi:hypothetical protein